MDKQQWKNYKRNNIDQIWWWANTSWVTELLNFPLIYFLNKFRLGRIIHREYMKLRFKIVKKPIIPIIEYMVTTRCTLNCKHCNSFMPRFTPETHSKISTFEEFKNDLDIILSAVDYINFIGFVGGEATLSNNLYKMIEYACQQRRINQVFLATNCTILPDEKLIKVMKHKKFAVQLSDYSHVTNIKTGATVKFHEFKKICKDNNIRYNSWQEKRGASVWFSMPRVEKDTQDPKAMKQQYQMCVQTCNVMCDGVLTPCTAGPYIYRNLELTDEIKNEIINIRNYNDPKILTEDLIKFYARPNPAYCHYCHFEDMKTNLPCGEQV